MSVGDRTRERIRWRCRRGLLELDLVLKAFLETHFNKLDDAGLDAFAHLLTRTDPELLDLVMGRIDSTSTHEREMVALLRAESINALQQSI
jgi:antitoxin CptB